MLEALRRAVTAHRGEFACRQIRHEQNRKVVRFRHDHRPPGGVDAVPEVRGLRAFFATFASVTLYLDDESGDAAFRIGSPAEWPQLERSFRPWITDLDPEIAAECVPPWVAQCLVVGEVPRSGNFLLVPVDGAEAGAVFSFDHDSLEFCEVGQDLEDFVLRALEPDERRLLEMASHMRFVAGDWSVQWWIEELRDDRGRVVRTGS